MTRGHLHAIIDRPELYYGLKGVGLMLMESPDGESRTLEIRRNTACYVPPYWIHRSMNLGEGDFVMLFCYPADSGQDYDIIERSNGMRLRIVDDGSGAGPAYRMQIMHHVALKRLTRSSASGLLRRPRRDKPMVSFCTRRRR